MSVVYTGPFVAITPKLLLIRPYWCYATNYEG